MYRMAKKALGLALRKAHLIALASALLFSLGNRNALCAQNDEALRARTPADQRIVSDPVSVPAVGAAFLKDSDMVVGVALKGDARAYWLPMVIWNHRILDRIGGTQILVTWCSLCNTGLVFRPEVDGKALTFTVQGLRGGNLVLQDGQTGSLWQQATGEAFEGPLHGKRLPRVAFQITSWGQWRKDHPNTLAMAADPHDLAAYGAMDQRISEPFWEMQPAPLALRQDSRLPPHTMVLGIEADATSAYPIDVIKDEGLINDRIGSIPVVLVYTASTDTVRAFSRQVDQKVLEFKAAGETRMTDTETASQWNFDGKCESGKHKGEELKPLIVEPSFWFAWAEFHPGTVVFSESR